MEEIQGEMIMEQQENEIKKVDEKSMITICEQRWHKNIKLNHHEICPICGSEAYHLTIPLYKLEGEVDGL